MSESENRSKNWKEENLETTWLQSLKKNGEMGQRISDFDWHSSAVGPVREWPYSLKSLVKTLLSSQYPMVLTWGRNFTQFYNDSYAKLIGAKHPLALGSDIRETLAESWHILGPMIERVMKTGIANWTPALPLLLERSGYREESYFSVSHAPAEDDNGHIVGMLAVCSEVTQQVIAERQTKLLRRIGTCLGEIRTIEQTCEDVGAILRDHREYVPFAVIYLNNENSPTYRLEMRVGFDFNQGHKLFPANLDLDQFRSPFYLVSQNKVVVIPNIDDRLDVKGGVYQDRVSKAVVFPFESVNTVPSGFIAFGVSPNRALDENYHAFFELLASQVSVSLRNVRLFDEEKTRAEMLASINRAKTQFFSNISHEFRTL